MLCAVMVVIRYDKTSDLHFLQEGFYRSLNVLHKLHKLPFFRVILLLKSLADQGKGLKIHLSSPEKVT